MPSERLGTAQLRCCCGAGDPCEMRATRHGLPAPQEGANRCTARVVLRPDDFRAPLQQSPGRAAPPRTQGLHARPFQRCPPDALLFRRPQTAMQHAIAAAWASRNLKIPN